MKMFVFQNGGKGCTLKYQISMLAWFQGFWTVFRITYTINIPDILF